MNIQIDLKAIPIEDGELYWLDRLLPDSATALQRLIAETAWRAETITLWGKRYPQPRLTAWHGEAGYRYSGLTLEPRPFTALQREILAAVERASGHRFNSVLLNYYRDQRDSMGMHSDDERELGPRPVIASLSLGQERQFVLRHKRSRQRVKLRLSDNGLLLMAGDLQANWQHGIPKETRIRGPRLNLTFRKIV